MGARPPFFPGCSRGGGCCCLALEMRARFGAATAAAATRARTLRSPAAACGHGRLHSKVERAHERASGQTDGVSNVVVSSNSARNQTAGRRATIAAVLMRPLLHSSRLFFSPPPAHVKQAASAKGSVAAAHSRLCTISACAFDRLFIALRSCNIKFA